MKIVGINIILPNYEAKYKVNEKIKISSTSGIKLLWFRRRKSFIYWKIYTTTLWNFL